jgi:predicted PurR-regulated permease PerM
MAAVTGVGVAAFILLGAISTLVGSQLINLAQNLPQYQYTIQEKIRALRSSAPGGDMIGRVVSVFQGVREELSSSNEPAPSITDRSAAPAKEPMPVRIEQQSQPLSKPFANGRWNGLFA